MWWIGFSMVQRPGSILILPGPTLAILTGSCQAVEHRAVPAAHFGMIPTTIIDADCYKDRMADKVARLDADDYLVKPLAWQNCEPRLRGACGNDHPSSATETSAGNLVLITGRLQYLLKIPSHKIIPLTAKEFQLLEYFIQHPNQILSREQLMNRVWQIPAEA